MGKGLEYKAKGIYDKGSFLKEEVKVLKRTGGRDWPSTGGNEREHKIKVSKMTQLLKAVVAKPDDLRSISRIYKAERENQLPQQSLIAWSHIKKNWKNLKEN